MWNIIKKLVDEKQWTNLIDNNNNISLYKYKMNDEKIIPRHGDILVGFYLDENSSDICEYTIGIDSNMIKPGEFKYAFGNTHCYPIIATSYHDIAFSIKETTNNLNDLYAVYALCDINSRRYLAQHTSIIKLKEYYYIIQGYICYYKYDDILPEHILDKRIIIEIPNMTKIIL